MTTQTLALWLLLAGSVLSQGCCQHWSYGLSPGGKRDLVGLSHTLSNQMDEGFPHVDAPCSVLGCEEESPFAKMCRMKGFLGSVTDRENGHRTYKK
ncbi:progonadoliberin-1-like [Pempheris klunzingeri]|uniref:progonadoliberin-1-like n=1 Tax=Pempheris klunzingeri TaxID=3127111 RepID=UPI00397FA78F